ncbi:MAG TPA: hypothetical protein PKA16_04865 [Ottowia sp.]|uniref:hypothetical protein n=1 Tax=Ottowia sp. TaxID=1898956 RepID=UPI002B514489|nr:hypothetical protein [Ottowia sp.]HMN20705.1 hypothetical protein [Ottowia sp.]
MSPPSNRFGRHAALAMASLCVAACSPRGEGPPPAPATVASAPAGAAAPACQSLRAFHAGTPTRLDITTDGNDEAYTVRFELTEGERSLATAGLNLPLDTPESIAIGTEQFPEFTTVCAGHVFVLNLPAERGGTLVIANLREGELALTQDRYMSGDEDTARLAWRDGALLVTTSTDGTRRLLEDARGDAAVPRGFVPEVLACTARDDGGTPWLSLGVDIDGGVREIEYAAVMPGSTGCNLSAARNDGESRWQDQGSATLIDFGDESEPEAPSRLRIERDGPRYHIDASQLLAHPQFCGQSAQLPEHLTLERAGGPCTDLRWPQ